jgi:ABC-type nitrate/sulfonate/bicarbonate transport system substrate-binding protein
MTELVVGFIPLLDCASIAVARELGFAEKEGLTLTLIRESSWANIRDRLMVGHFDAAHMLGPMAVASSLGIGHVRVPVIAPFSLGLGGNAVTVSTAVRREMLAYESELSRADGGAASARVAGEALRRVVAARARSGLAPLTFGMVYPFSCHNYELRYWLAASGIDPDRDVRLVVIPPPLLDDSMMAGYIDGFCVGEPWNSVAAEAGAGSILLPTTAIWRRSPEKVLGCRADWAARHPDSLCALLRSLFRASAWCADPANHAELATLLAEPRYVGESRELLGRALAGRPVLSKGEAPAEIDDYFVPFAHAATFPWLSHALWYYSQMVRWGQTQWSDADLDVVRGTYRPDLYRSALADLDANLPATDTREEHFFDAKPYDPTNLRAYL